MTSQVPAGTWPVRRPGSRAVRSRLEISAERYTPFAALLRADGYRVHEFAQGVAPEVLAECDLLVIVGPIADPKRGDRAFPHVPAFARVELEDLIAWIRAGGRLLFIVGEPRPELPRHAAGPVAGHRHSGVVARGGEEDGEREGGVARRVHDLHHAAGR